MPTDSMSARIIASRPMMPPRYGLGVRIGHRSRVGASFAPALPGHDAHARSLVAPERARTPSGGEVRRRKEFRPPVP